MRATAIRFMALFALWAGVAAAQQERATVTGVVQDPSGAVIPGASILATSPTN